MKASLKQTNKLSSLKFKCWSWRRIPRSTLWTRTCFTLQHNSPVVQVKTALQTHIKQSQTEFIFMEELWFIPFAPWDIFYFSSWLEVIHLVLLHEVKYFISWDLLSVLYWSKNSYNFIKNSQYSQRATKKDCNMQMSAKHVHTCFFSFHKHVFHCTHKPPEMLLFWWLCSNSFQ